MWASCLRHTLPFAHRTLSSSTRLSKIVSGAAGVSRREAERLIQGGAVKVDGAPVRSPMLLVDDGVDIQVTGRKKLCKQSSSSRIWLAHKLPGELVAEHDPYGRPSMLERLRRGVVGDGHHLKPIGRLDMMTEGLLLVTTDGEYARAMEHPSSAVHRRYRVRAHGRLDNSKLRRLRAGLTVDAVRYAGMKVSMDGKRRRPATNQWLQVTCTEGKNRQIRKVFEHLGLKVTRLIRVAYGDYQLDTIPPGLAIEVPIKPLQKQRHKGNLFVKRTPNKPKTVSSEQAPPVEWIRYS